MKYLKVPAERTVQLDNLVEVAAIRRCAEEPASVEKVPGAFTVVHAGRFHAQKNQAMLLDAFARLDGDAQLWMLGEGPLEDELRSRADRLGIASRVRWLGFQANPFAYLRAADCLALSSDWEGLPNVVIEAMVCGTAVVATRCPFGPDELIDDGRTGLLVPTGDVPAFAAALQHLASNEGARLRLAAAARRAADDRFFVERPGSGFESLFEEVAGEPSQAKLGHGRST